MDGYRERAAVAARSEGALVVGLVSGSHVVNHMYLVLLPPIVGVLAGEFGVSLAAMGLAMGAVGVTNTTFQLPFGYLSDNYSRTWTLGLSLLFGTLGAAIIALAPSYPGLVLGQLVLGVGIAGHHPAHYPLLADATPEAYRGRAFSIHGFAGSLGFAAPPAVVTAVLGIGLSWRHAVGLVAVIGGLYAALATLVLARRVPATITRPPERARAGPRASRSPRGRVAAGLRSLASSRVILALALLALVTSTASWGVTSYAVVLLTDGYGVALSTANLALTGMFTAGAVAILVGGELTDRIAPGPVMVGSYAAVALVVAVVASLAIPPLAAVAGVVAVGGTRSLGAPARSKLADGASARGDLGQNFAVITVGIMLGGAVAPPVFGAVLDAAGPRTAFFAIAGIALLATLLTVAIVHTYRARFDAAVARPGD